MRKAGRMDVKGEADPIEAPRRARPLIRPHSAGSSGSGRRTTRTRSSGRRRDWRCWHCSSLGRCCCRCRPVSPHHRLCRVRASRGDEHTYTAPCQSEASNNGAVAAHLASEPEFSRIAAPTRAEEDRGAGEGDCSAVHSGAALPRSVMTREQMRTVKHCEPDSPPLDELAGHASLVSAVSISVPSDWSAYAVSNVQGPNQRTVASLTKRRFWVSRAGQPVEAGQVWTVNFEVAMADAQPLAVESGKFHCRLLKASVSKLVLTNGHSDSVSGPLASRLHAYG